MKRLEIDYEIADRIALCVMKDQLSYLKEEIRLHVEEGKYLHPEDYHKSMTEYIPALELLIVYFGGQDEV
jgi:hypothetical protein